MFGLPAVNEVGEVFTFYFKSVFPYIMPVIYPVGMIAQTGSVYLGSQDRTAGFMKLEQQKCVFYKTFTTLRINIVDWHRSKSNTTSGEMSWVSQICCSSLCTLPSVTAHHPSLASSSLLSFWMISCRWLSNAAPAAIQATKWFFNKFKVANHYVLDYMPDTICNDYY